MYVFIKFKKFLIFSRKTLTWINWQLLYIKSLLFIVVIFLFDLYSTNVFVWGLITEILDL